MPRNLIRQRPIDLKYSRAVRKSARAVSNRALRRVPTIRIACRGSHPEAQHVQAAALSAYPRARSSRSLRRANKVRRQSIRYLLRSSSGNRPSSGVARCRHHQTYSGGSRFVQRHDGVGGHTCKQRPSANSTKAVLASRMAGKRAAGRIAPSQSGRTENVWQAPGSPAQACPTRERAV